MTAALPYPVGSDSPAPLCPSCGNPVVRIETSVEVKYHVHYAVTARDLEVIAEQLGDSCWDEHTPAACDACGWRGEVGALARGE